MCADDDRVRVGLPGGRLDDDVDVANRLAVAIVFLPADGVSVGFERRLQIECDLFQLAIVRDVMFAGGNRRDVTLERRGDRALLAGHRRECALIRRSGNARQIGQDCKTTDPEKRNAAKKR